MPQLLASDATYLKDVHEVGFVGHLEIQHDVMEVEILEGKVIVKNVRSQKLLAADVHRVFRNLVVFAQVALSGGQFNLGTEGLLGARRQHYRPVSADAQLQAAEEAGVVKEEPDVGRARRHDVASQGGGKKCLALDEGEVVDLARLGVLVGDPRLRIGRGDLHQLLMNNGQPGAHAVALIFF